MFVDEEENVLALVAEVLRHRQAGEADAQARAGGLVHLPVDERDAVDHAGLSHLEPEVVPLAGALADAGEDRHAAVLLGDVVDQLLDQHRLAETGAAEQADLAAADERRDQVDDLDSGLEDLRLRGELAELRRIAVDRPAFGALGAVPLVDGLAEHVPEPAEGDVAHGDADRRAGVDHVDTARQAVGRVHGDRAHRSSPRCCWTSAISSTPPLPSAPGIVIESALLICGSSPVKTASMTTPFTSTTLPTFCSATLLTPATKFRRVPPDAGSTPRLTKQRH